MATVQFQYPILQSRTRLPSDRVRRRFSRHRPTLGDRQATRSLGNTGKWDGSRRNEHSIRYGAVVRRRVRFPLGRWGDPGRDTARLFAPIHQSLSRTKKAASSATPFGHHRYALGNRSFSAPTITACDNHSHSSEGHPLCVTDEPSLLPRSVKTTA